MITNGGALECGICFENFQTFEELDLHSHLPASPPPNRGDNQWPCDLCLSTFNFESHLKRHRVRHFDPQLQCPNCEKRYYDEFTLKRHLLVAHEIQSMWSCDLCTKTYKSEGALKKHKLRHFDRKVKCPQCEKLFFDEAAVKQHRAFVHSNTKNYICNVCNYATADKGSLQRHIIRMHTKDFPHVCEICGKGYTEKSLLETHRKVVHEGKHFVCEICGKEFNFKKGLRNHRKLHDQPGLRDHRKVDDQMAEKETTMCELCGGKFRYLREHVIKMHGGEKSIICEVCGRRFHASYELKIHMIRKHDDVKSVKCTICGHAVVTKEELKLHMERRHLHVETPEEVKEKPFQCNICGKRYKVKVSLKDHMRRHLGEKTYSCGSCQEKFYTLHLLKLHKCISSALASALAPINF